MTASIDISFTKTKYLQPWTSFFREAMIDNYIWTDIKWKTVVVDILWFIILFSIALRKKCLNTDRPEKIPYLDTFYAVLPLLEILKCRQISEIQSVLIVYW